MEATRSKCTDERMDEFAQRTEESFKDVRAELKSEIGGLRGEMNHRFARLEDKIDRSFNILFGALATGFVAAVAQHFLG
jgi:chromosome segregation ATPase